MKILLVKPYNLSDHVQPSLGLGYLATALRGQHEVEILDCIKEGLKAKSLSERLEEARADVVGMQCYTFDLKFVKEAFAACRAIGKGIVTVVGGPHSTADPDGTIGHLGDSIDFGFAGEAELGMPKLLDRLQRGGPLDDVQGLIWRREGEVAVNERSYVEDLDELGFAAWDLIKPESYPEAQHGAFYKKFPIAPIMLTRGCPYSCTFCSAGLMAGRKLRKRSIGHILDEIELLYWNHGIREIHIVDDNFTLDRAYAKQFLLSLKNLSLDISLATPNGVRIDTIDDELLALMKENGLYMLSLGIESGSDRILKLMKKGITVAEVKEATERIRRAGIDMAGFFIIGFPGETKEEIEATIRFSTQLGLKRANFFAYLPFPGTESYFQLERSGELARVNWDKFYFMSAPYSPDGLTQKKLRRLQRKAFLKFYARPRILLENIADIRSFTHLKYLGRRFFHWILMR